MILSDTTNKNGLIQRIEYLARIPDGGVTGTLYKQIVTSINASFDKIMPLLLSYSDHIRWDDSNHTDRPIGTVNIVSGQSDYTLTSDDNSLAILNLVGVRVLESASATEYTTIPRINVDDDRYFDAISPNPSVSGVPVGWVENENTVFLYPEPNYSVANGIKLLFEREQSRFATDGTDNAVSVGIPVIFHDLLALYVAQEYVEIYRPEDGNTITRLNQKIAQMRQDLFDMISLRNPQRIRMSTYEDNE